MKKQRITIIVSSFLILAGILLAWRWTNQVARWHTSPPRGNGVPVDLPSQPNKSAEVGHAAETRELTRAPQNTVVWISIDGFRPDYWERGRTPFFDRLASEGAYSRELVPVFPSLTFPSHVSQATGVLVQDHGVPGNSFIDRADLQLYAYPGDAALSMAEPIWITAAAQGVRSAVYDWPLSHAQRSPIRAEYFGDRFEPSLSDTERLGLLVTAWESESRIPPLRLLMGYVSGPDSVGHRFGPEAPEPVTKLEETDLILQQFTEKALQLWNRHREPDDHFYLLLTTDHGMLPVHSVVNLERLAEIEGDDSLMTVQNGNVGHIVFQDRGTAEKDPERIQKIMDRIREHKFAKAFARDELPPAWGFNHPTRTGDIVIILDGGYTFSHDVKGVVVSADESRGPLGMHGYDPATYPEMNGALFLWRAETPLGGLNLGRVDSLQLHATVAHLLGIRPAANASQVSIEIEPPPN